MVVRGVISASGTLPLCGETAVFIRCNWPSWVFCSRRALGQKQGKICKAMIFGLIEPSVLLPKIKIFAEFYDFLDSEVDKGCTGPTMSPLRLAG